jgi:biotin transporter BioY
MMFVAIVAGVIVGWAEGTRLLRSRVAFALISIFMLAVCVYSFGIGHMSTWDWGLAAAALCGAVLFYLIPCVLTAAVISLARWLRTRKQPDQSKST